MSHDWVRTDALAQPVDAARAASSDSKTTTEFPSSPLTPTQ